MTLKVNFWSHFIKRVLPFFFLLGLGLGSTLPFSLVSLFGQEETEQTILLPNGEKVTEFTAIAGAETVTHVLEKSQKYLENYGIFFHPKRGWDFKDLKLNPSQLKGDKTEYNRFKTALRLAIGSESGVTQILDPNRKKAIQIGASAYSNATVLLPPDASEGKVKGLNQKTYDTQVNEVKDKIKKEMNHYLDKVEQANQYFTLQSREGLYAEADLSLKSANDLLRQRLIKDFGVDESQLKSVLNVTQEALKLEKEKISGYSASLRNAILTAAVAPIIPLVIPLLPGAGAAVAVKGSALSGLIGLGLGYSKIVGHAAFDSSKAGAGDFQSHLTDTLAKEGGEAVIWGVVGTVIPAGLRGAGIGYHALRAGKISIDAAQLMVNLGSAIGFGLVAIAGGIQGSEHCASLLKTARDAVTAASQGEGSPQVAETQFTEAKKACLDVGIDLAFFLIQSGLAGKKAYEAYLTKRTTNLTQAREAKLGPHEAGSGEIYEFTDFDGKPLQGRVLGGQRPFKGHEYQMELVDSQGKGTGTIVKGKADDFRPVEILVKKSSTPVKVKQIEVTPPDVILARAQNVLRRANKSKIEDLNITDLLKLTTRVEECSKNPGARTPENFKIIEKLTQDVLTALEQVPAPPKAGDRRYPPPSLVDTMVGGKFKNQAKIPFFQDSEIIKKYTPIRVEQLQGGGSHSSVEVSYSKHGMPIIQQQALRGCTAAASAMLIKQNGKTPSVQDLIETNLGNASTMEVSIRQAKLKPQTTEFRGTKTQVLTQLRALIHKNGSAIVGVGGEIGGHVIVVDQVSLSNQSALIRDPFHGWEIRVTLDALAKRIGPHLEATQVVP